MTDLVRGESSSPQRLDGKKSLMNRGKTQARSHLISTEWEDHKK